MTRHAKAKDHEHDHHWKFNFWQLIMLILTPIMGAALYWMLLTPAIMWTIVNALYTSMISRSMSSERGKDGIVGVNTTLNILQMQHQEFDTPNRCECQCIPSVAHCIHKKKVLKNEQKT